MPSIPREERILNLLSALLAARRPLSFSRIRREVSGYGDEGVSDEALEKRFDRDKTDLRGLGVPLEFVKDETEGGQGYRIAKDRFFLDEIQFTVEEGIVLAALQRSVVAGANDAFAASLRSALAKIGVDSPLPETFRESVGEQQLLDARVAGAGAADTGPMAVLSKALARRRPVRFTYYSLGAGKRTKRTVQPWGVGYFEGHWYLVGKDVDKGEERVFRTSRMENDVEEVDGAEYPIPEEFDLADRIGLPPWEMKEGPAVRARIWFAPEIAWMMEETGSARPGRTFELQADGSGILELTATDPLPLVWWLAQYGPLAEILAPSELRAEMERHLEGVLAGGAP